MPKVGATDKTASPTFSPERITDFELDSKSCLFDRHLDLAFSVCCVSVRNYQALTFDEDQTLIPNPQQNNLLNIGRLRGVEAVAAIGNAVRLRAGVSCNEAITVEHGRASYVEAYHLSNARLSIGALGQRWELVAWVRNLFDTEYVAAVQPLYGVGDYGSFAGDPRMAGLTARFNW